MYYVYVIKNQEGLLYKGISGNVEKCLEEHNRDKGVYTRNKGPWIVVYREICKNRLEARKREKYLKSGVGREYLKIVIPR